MSRDLDDWHYGAAGGAAAGSSEASMGGGGEAAGDSHDNDLVMPGFRFHPTEEELIDFYLRRKVEGRRFNVDLIADLDLYCFDPWELPARAVMGGKEWFFYVPRDRKYRNGDRPNRVTASGYWKATGADRMIRGENNRPIGLKKTLVFYSGKAPKGVRSSWIMNEYRLPPPAADAEPLTHKSEISLCRVYKRSGIDDGRGQPSSSSTQASAGRRTRSGRHMSTSSASSPLSPIPSSFHLLQGECPSASPPAIMDQMMITADNVSQLVLPPTARAFAPPGNSLAAVAPAEGATILASTDSLLNMAAVPMGISGPVDKLGTVVGDSQAYANHISAATGSDFLPLPSTQPMSQVAPLGALPMTAPLSSVDDKLGWDWNPVPDTTTRDYRTSIFK